MTESISVLTKALLPIAKAHSPKIRTLCKERQAGRMPIRDTSNLLEKRMDESIKRIVDDKADDTWWKGILAYIGHKFIAPEFLRVQAIREWLSVHQVQTDFKSLARNHIMGQEDYEQDTFQRLNQTYADKTGENERLASGPIDVMMRRLWRCGRRCVREPVAANLGA